MPDRQRKLIRGGATILILGLTIAAFGYYFKTHPAVRHGLNQVSIVTVLVLFVLYAVSIVALSFVTVTTLRICGVRLGNRESFLLTGYSSIINFFGPLQSGPAFRALYLKKRHRLQLRKYTAATLLYYLLYAICNGLFLLTGLLKGWLLLGIPAFLCVGYLVSRTQYIRTRFNGLKLQNIYPLALATFIQSATYAAIYYTELRTVVPGVHFGQAVSYTGAANFSLFVSLTPGAVGFRESFLVFSQRIHHISNNAIVTANIIDRSVYIATLLILAILIFATHARRRLSVE